MVLLKAIVVLWLAVDVLYRRRLFLTALSPHHQLAHETLFSSLTITLLPPDWCITWLSAADSRVTPQTSNIELWLVIMISIQYSDWSILKILIGQWLTSIWDFFLTFSTAARNSPRVVCSSSAPTGPLIADRVLLLNNQYNMIGHWSVNHDWSVDHGKSLHHDWLPAGVAPHTWSSLCFVSVNITVGPESM